MRDDTQKITAFIVQNPDVYIDAIEYRKSFAKDCYVILILLRREGFRKDDWFQSTVNPEDWDEVSNVWVSSNRPTVVKQGLSPSAFFESLRSILKARYEIKRIIAKRKIDCIVYPDSVDISLLSVGLFYSPMVVQLSFGVKQAKDQAKRQRDRGRRNVKRIIGALKRFRFRRLGILNRKVFSYLKNRVGKSYLALYKLLVGAKHNTAASYFLFCPAIIVPRTKDKIIPHHYGYHKSIYAADTEKFRRVDAVILGHPGISDLRVENFLCKIKANERNRSTIFYVPHPLGDLNDNYWEILEKYDVEIKSNLTWPVEYDLIYGELRACKNIYTLHFCTALIFITEVLGEECQIFFVTGCGKNGRTSSGQALLETSENLRDRIKCM